MSNIQNKKIGALQRSDLATTETSSTTNPVVSNLPSKPSNPQFSIDTSKEVIGSNVKTNNVIDSQQNMSFMQSASPEYAVPVQGYEGMREVMETTDSNIYSETFSDKVPSENLPLLIQEPRSTQDNPADEDKMTLASLTTYSGRMPNVRGKYDSAMLYSPIYQIITGPSGVSQKGPIEACRQLVKPIDNELKEKYESQMGDYEKRQAEYETNKNKKSNLATRPQPPIRQTVFIPANSSATSTYQQLADNGGVGIIFETEADTLTQALAQDYGKYSDGLRKAFHHETINYSRRKDNEYVNVEEPKLAVLLSCTPRQIPLLLPANNVENGLANRFLYYNKKSKRKWRSPWKDKGEPLKDRFFAIGKKYYELYKELQKRSDNPLEFTLTHEQQEEFDKFFEPLYDEQIALQGETIEAFIVRIAVTAFRIAMILTVLRCYENRKDLDPEKNVLVCRDVDFQTTLTIINCLINHTVYVYNNLLQHTELDNPQIAAMSAQEQQLYNALDDEFRTKTLHEIANGFGIPRSTAERYLKNFWTKYLVVQRVKNGLYRKVNNKR